MQSWGGCNARAISTEVQIRFLDPLGLFHNVKTNPIHYIVCLRLTSTLLLAYKHLYSAHCRSWFMIKCCIWPFDARKQEMTKSFCPPLWSRLNISTTVGWIVKKSHKDIHDPQKIKPTDIGNVLTGTRWINKTFSLHIMVQRRMNSKFFVDSFYSFRTMIPSDFGKPWTCPLAPPPTMRLKRSFHASVQGHAFIWSLSRSGLHTFIYTKHIF